MEQPSPIAHASARVLEFDHLRDLLRGYATSPLGQSRVVALEPTANRDWIERQHRLTTEIRQYLKSGARFEFGGLLDVSRLLEKARIAGVALEPNDLRDILVIADRADEWTAITRNPPSTMRAPAHAEGTGSPWPSVAELSRGLGDFIGLLRGFRNKIRPDGSLEDNASSALSHIRREIEKQRRHIQSSLQSYLRRLAEGDTLQEELVTIRGERFVIPVKVEQQKRVQGVVHGMSSSGRTVFVEPLETIEQNNELVRLLEDEQTEIHRILLEMTARIGESAGDISRAADILSELELQFAKARFAEDYDGCMPRFTTSDSNESLVLHNARHPLLVRTLRPKGIDVVPISVELPKTDRQLVISGPNTGGKTVSLKTVGLLALMAQAGIPVMADKCELPVFDAVLADIGDYQSIEQNLSTFSAHVTNIDFISRTATHDSLVLLDELGSATDPEEGSALAVSIADHFRRIAAISIISTHHTSLKVYGANNPGVMNAAVGFDERTLQPTYELRVGVPGASAGINIAQRLGLNPTIIEAARGLLSTQTQDIATFLDRLHRDLREVEDERARTRQREQELDRERKRLEAEGMKEQRAKIREMEQKVDDLMRDFEYRVREVVNAVQDRAAATKLSKDAEKRIAKLRREFRESFDSTVVAHVTGADKGDPHARPEIVQQVSEGDTVKLRSLGRNAVVRRKLDGDKFEVEAGIMKMTVPRSDIAEVVIRIANSPVQAARAKGINVKLDTDDLSAPSEINVIGQTVDDATREVEKFVDRAFLAGMPRIRIVHGSGMGILRKAIRQYLQKHPHVANVTEPPQNEGGGGATVVDLRI
ncbi:MAG TPA: endonuclease MutS2 [Terriglobales bacterium]|nr:endonuclease MutS2 [Terriglobales bacterium]